MDDGCMERLGGVGKAEEEDAKAKVIDRVRVYGIHVGEGVTHHWSSPCPCYCLGDDSPILHRTAYTVPAAGLLKAFLRKCVYNSNSL